MMPVNDTDKLLVNDGSKTETITFAQFKDGTVLNDSDKFLINDGTKTETVTWAQIEDELGPKGVVNTPTVLKPKDGAGSGEERYLKTDTIIDVEGGDIITCETDTIQSVGDEVAGVPWEKSEGIITKDLTDISAWCTSQGITAVTGFKFIVSPDLGEGYSTELGEFEIDGVSLRGSNTPILTDTGGWYGASTPEFWMGGNPRVQATGSGGDIAQFTFEPIAVVGTVKIECVATRDNIYLLDQDGKEHLAFGSSANKVLTFPSSNGFGCFEPGDVVQKDATGTDNPAWNETRIWSNGTITNENYLSRGWNQAFDGTTSNFVYCTASGESTLEFNPPIPAGDFQFAHSNGSSNSVTNTDVGIRLYNASGTEIVKVPPITRKNPNIYDSTTYTANEPVAKIGLKGGGTSSNYANSYCIGAIKYEGLILVDALSETEVKVISKDEDANTIIVDGGTWVNDSQVWSDGADKSYLSYPMDEWL